VQHLLTKEEAEALKVPAPKDDPARFDPDIPAAFLKFLKETTK